MAMNAQPTQSRRLIVNADDFGRSVGITDGIGQAHEHGIVTSASLMVRWPAARAAAAYARAHPSLSVGLHFDLCEWTVADGEWRPVYEVVSGGDAASVSAELERQLSSFEALVGRPPTHLDSHHHVHREDPVRAAVIAAGERIGVPVRECSAEIAYLGGFYGQAGKGEPYPEGISREHLIDLIRLLPAGTTELGCHPAAEPELESGYAHERPVELSVLCDPAVAAAVRDESIELSSFAQITARRTDR
jgi:chitin disaccharide deacetylase